MRDNHNGGANKMVQDGLGTRCDSCAHKSVCIYKAKYEELEERLREIERREKEPESGDFVKRITVECAYEMKDPEKERYEKYKEMCCTQMVNMARG